MNPDIPFFLGAYMVGIVDTSRLNMTPKAKFTLLWTSGGLFGACILLGLVAPLLLWWHGDIDEHASKGTKYTYTFLPMLPLVVAAVCLLLCLFGKLPGTKAK